MVWPFGITLTEEQVTDLERSLGLDPATKASSFDLENASDEDFAAFLEELEASENEHADKEIEKLKLEAKRVLDLKASIED